MSSINNNLTIKDSTDIIQPEDFTLPTETHTNNSKNANSSNNNYNNRIVVTDTNDNTGIYFLLVAQFFNTIMSLSTKLLVTDHLRQEQNQTTTSDSEDNSSASQDSIHPFEILFVRMAITLFFSFIYTRRNNITIFFKESGFPIVKLLLCARGTFGFMGAFGLYSSLKYLSISDAISITFLAPLFASVLAHFFLKEKYYRVEAYCSIVALIGVLLITRPSFFHLSETASTAPIESETGGDGIIEGNAQQRVIGSLYGLFGVIGGSTIYIIIKKIGNRADAILSVTYFSIIVCIISFFGVMFSPNLHFKLPNSKMQWFLFLVIGISGFVMQFFLTIGIQREKRTSRSSLIIYTQLIYGIVWEVLFFRHFPDALSIIGMFIILACTVVATLKKQKKNYSKQTQEQKSDFLKENNDVEVDFELDDLETTTPKDPARTV